MVHSLLLDVGTTNARVWLTEGERIVAEGRAMVGVRDAAREGGGGSFRDKLGALIAEVRRKSPADSELSGAFGAGMLASPLGLAAVPHVGAPAGLAEIVAGVQRFSFPEVLDSPFWLIPGVRTGPGEYDFKALETVDVMRGEETTILGLLDLNLARPGDWVFNLGSHWKMIRVDREGRVAASLTSLAGEMIYAAQTQTILAESVPHAPPTEINPEWCEAGLRETERRGLPRSLFAVRLLQLGGRSSPAERLSFLIGATIGADLPNVLENLTAVASHPASSRLVIAGKQILAETWAAVLRRRGAEAVVLTESDVTRGFVRGLQLIAARITSRA